MDSQDLNRRLIGLLTLAYNALPELETGQTDEDFDREFSRTVDGLMEGWGATYTANLDLPPAYMAQAQAELQRFEKDISGDVTALFGMFAGIFVRVCQDVQDQCSDADIPAILQAIALEAAADE